MTGAKTPLPRDDDAEEGSHGHGSHERGCGPPRSLRHLAPAGVATRAVQRGRWTAWAWSPHLPTIQLPWWWVGSVGTATAVAIPPPHLSMASGCARQGKGSSAGGNARRRWGVMPCRRQRRGVGPPVATAPTPAPAARTCAGGGEQRSAASRRRRPGHARLGSSLAEVITELISQDPCTCLHRLIIGWCVASRRPVGRETGATGVPRCPALRRAAALEREVHYDACSVFLLRTVCCLLLLGHNSFPGRDAAPSFKSGDGEPSSPVVNRIGRPQALQYTPIAAYEDGRMKRGACSRRNSHLDAPRPLEVIRRSYACHGALPTLHQQ